MKHLLKAGDSYAAVEYIQSQGSSAEIAALYSAATIHFLQKEKDVAAFVRLSQAGIHYELTLAQLTKDPRNAIALRSAAKSLAYDLAANVWQGWGPGTFKATQEQQMLGLDAAKLNLRIAKELKKPVLKLSYAYWMLAASQLGLGNYAAAKTGFLAATAAAKEAKKPAVVLSAQGFLAVTQILSGKLDNGMAALAKTRLQLTELDQTGNEDAAFFATQFAHALKAFQKKDK